MQIHYFQHVAFEGPAFIERWALCKGHTLTATKFYENDLDIKVGDIDWLVVMGGPMNIHEENKYPWLKKEKAFIKKAIKSGKTVIGICLGAQLIADVLGAKVYKGKHCEIGWWPIEFIDSTKQSMIFNSLPDNGRLTVFHWHEDTFSIPDKAVCLAKSEGCENQAFIYKERVLGLQFHLESTEESVRQIVQNCHNGIMYAKYVQSAMEILSPNTENFSKINIVLEGMLNRLSIP